MGRGVPLSSLAIFELESVVVIPSYLSRALFRREPCSERGRVRICPRAERVFSSAIIRWLPHNVRVCERNPPGQPSRPPSLLSCLANVSGEFPRTLLTLSRGRRAVRLIVEGSERSLFIPPAPSACEHVLPKIKRGSFTTDLDIPFVVRLSIPLVSFHFPSSLARSPLLVRRRYPI